MSRDAWGEGSSRFSKHRVSGRGTWPARRGGFAWKSKACRMWSFRQGDLLDRESLLRALEGQDAAVVLVHSMGGRSAPHYMDYIESDIRAAENFLWAADDWTRDEPSPKTMVGMIRLPPFISMTRRSASASSSMFTHR